MCIENVTKVLPTSFLNQAEALWILNQTLNLIFEMKRNLAFFFLSYISVLKADNSSRRKYSFRKFVNYEEEKVEWKLIALKLNISLCYKASLQRSF